MIEKVELIFVEPFHSLFSLDDELNIAQSVIFYFHIMLISIDVYGIKYQFGHNPVLSGKPHGPTDRTAH